jgi:hypothetical protein
MLKFNSYQKKKILLSVNSNTLGLYSQKRNFLKHTIGSSQEILQPDPVVDNVDLVRTQPGSLGIWNRAPDSVSCIT